MSDFDADCELIQGKTRDELNYILNNSTENELELYLNIIKLILADKKSAKLVAK